MDINDIAMLKQSVEILEHPSLFVTVSGAHLYGFASPNSDFDLRGAFVLPIHSVIGLKKPDETVTHSLEESGRTIDLVSHDIGKFLRMMLNKNGYVLEQLYSPLVVLGGSDFEELRELGKGCITRHLYHHYRGFSHGQIRQFETEFPMRVKTLLYVYRVLMTGIWVLERGEVEANLLRLNDSFRLPFIIDLIEQKRQENAILDEGGLSMYEESIVRLQERLESAFQDSVLPESPAHEEAMNDFLIRLRVKGLHE